MPVNGQGKTPWCIQTANRVQKKFQPSSSCKIFTLNFSLLRQSKLAKVFELCIVHVLKNFYCRKAVPFTANVALTKILLKLDCSCILINIPQIRDRKQNLPPAQNRGAVTFSGLYLRVPGAHSKIISKFTWLLPSGFFSNYAKLCCITSSHKSSSTSLNVNCLFCIVSKCMSKYA